MNYPPSVRLAAAVRVVRSYARIPPAAGGLCDPPEEISICHWAAQCGFTKR